MVSACNDFVSNHGEDLETLLYKGVASDVEMRNRLCIETKLCNQLWDAEAEELKRDRSPEESKREVQEQAREAKERAKKKKEQGQTHRPNSQE